MIEVNANAKFARRHKLRSSGDGTLQVDGPAGFRLSVRVMGGAPVIYSRVGSPATGLLRRGEPVASNAQLVERTVRIARELERRPATPDEARERFGLRGRVAGATPAAT